MMTSSLLRGSATKLLCALEATAEAASPPFVCISVGAGTDCRAAIRLLRARVSGAKDDEEAGLAGDGESEPTGTATDPLDVAPSVPDDAEADSSDVVACD